MAETCPICEGTEHKRVFTERQHDLLTCQTCDLFFISPYPRVTEQYSTVEEYDYDELEILNAQKHYRSAQLFYDQYFDRIAAEVGDAKSFLDVGCGTGCLLERLSSISALHREGIELNSARAEFARKQAGCTVHSVPIEKFEPAERFDCISLINVFSHVPDIGQLFVSLKRVLAPNGKLILKVGELSPNIRKEATYDWQIPDHLQFMGLGTIEYLAKKYQFRIERHDRIQQADELFAKERWLAPGRSVLRNMLKLGVVYTPFALGYLKSRYSKKHHDTLFSSLMVLRPES